MLKLNSVIAFILIFCCFSCTRSNVESNCFFHRYSEDGLSHFQMKNEVRHGSFLTEHNDSQVAGIGSYSLGKVNGYCHHFSTDGRLEVSTYFKEGLKHGLAWRYDSAGMQSQYAYYHGDTLIYIAFYDSLRFVKYRGSPMALETPKKGLQIDGEGLLNFSLELVKPPAVKHRLSFVEFENGKAKNLQYLEFKQGPQDFSVEVFSEAPDSCGLFYEHITPLKNGHTQAIKAVYCFPVYR